MDKFPDHVLCEIFSRITDSVDRSAISLTSKRFHNLDNKTRNCIRVGYGFNPNKALRSLCHRFPNLNKVEMVHSGWRSGKHLDDQSLVILSNACSVLTDLTISYCTAITDTGLSSLASCSKLSSLKLEGVPRIKGCGMSSVVTGCKNLKKIHLIRCSKFCNLEWVECLGRQETLEDLCIENCRYIGEDALMKLGPTWGKLKRLHFQASSKYLKSYDKLAVDRWQKQSVLCENMVELILINCMIVPGRGLTCILDKCKNLERIHLDMCIGARDCDIIGLSQTSRNLRAILLRVPSDSRISLLMDIPARLTDLSLKSLAQNCKQLKSVTLSFSDAQLPSPLSFSLNGIINLIQTCPVKHLYLDCVYSFNNIGMEAVCASCHLRTLDLVRCHQVSDEGLKFVAYNPCLRVLRLIRCLDFTDDGFKPLVSLCNLKLLVVNECPHVSVMGVQGAAKSVSHNENLPWMI